MDLQYYIKYIVSWIYHNIINTDVTLSIVRILIIIGLVSLLVYGQYTLFTLLCIVVVCAEVFMGSTLFSLNGAAAAVAAATDSRASTLSHHTVDKDELTTGVALTREGFSIGLPKIVKGDDSGKYYQRSNKFIEEDSRDFSEKYFTSKQCSIGSGVGSITMFGDNQIIGSRRDLIYDYQGKWTPNDSGGDSAKRYTYFKDCVYDTIQRNDFRLLKKEMYAKINESIIDIPKCLARFNIGILFKTRSDMTADISTQVTLSDKKDGSNVAEIASVSVINGEDNAAKLANIQPLNGGSIGDNANEATYTALMNETNVSTSGIYEAPGSRDYRKQIARSVYGKVFEYRKRIDVILSEMVKQTKQNKANLYTVRVSEDLIRELRRMLAYLALVEQSNNVITFEQSPNNMLKDKITNVVAGAGPDPSQDMLDPLPFDTKETISGAYNIFGIPLEDNTYNMKDEQRYLYGITYYFDKSGSDTPVYTRR